MESFGEKLRTARQSLGYSIEQIARDTHISKRYLVALEDEDFSLFPGETYLKGFLQNYSEYLGLDPEEMIAIYRNMKIQEQPIPLDQLLDQKPLYRKRPLIIAVIGGIIVLAALIVLFIYFNPLEINLAGSADDGNMDNEIAFEGQKMSVDLADGMVISVSLSGGKQKITAQKVEKEGITLAVGDNPDFMIIGEEKYFDLDNDGTPDIAIFLTGIREEQNQNQARITLQQPVMGEREDIITNASDLELVERGIAKVIEESANPERFAISITIVKNCYIIFYIDKNQREEKMNYKGDTISLTAERSADVRFSNGGAVKLTVSGIEIDSGPADQLFAVHIKWMKGTGDNYQLIALPVK